MLSDQNFMENLEGEVLFVLSGSSMEVSYLIEGFFVCDEVAYHPKDSDASISVPLTTSIPVCRYK